MWEKLLLGLTQHLSAVGSNPYAANRTHVSNCPTRLVERSLPTPEIRGSNIINGNFIYVLPVNCIIKVVP